jgi:hypothetical protein
MLKMTGAPKRDAGGISFVNTLLASVHDENIDKGNKTTISIYKYWLSAKLTPILYRIQTDKNYIIAYISMNLKA